MHVIVKSRLYLKQQFYSLWFFLFLIKHLLCYSVKSGNSLVGDGGKIKICVKMKRCSLPYEKWIFMHVIVKSRLYLKQQFYSLWFDQTGD
jgi:hypothetical protein